MKRFAMVLVMLLATTLVWAAEPGQKPAEPVAPAGDSLAPVVLWTGSRIPTIDVTTKGTLLAFAQKGGGDNHPNHVEMRRSTDGGKTWGKPQDLDGGRKINHVNISSIVDHKTGTIWVFFADRWSKDGKKVRLLKHCRSDDDGLTWSPAEAVQIDGHSVDGVPSCANGIQLSTGRLLLPVNVWHSTVRKGDSTINVPRSVYSDDHGKTWQFGNEPNTTGKDWGGSYEYTLLELADGRVYMNHRNNMGAVRLVSFSGDGGITWGKPQRAADLVQPKGNGCHSGLARLTHPKTDDKGRVLFSCPWGWGKEKFGRQDLTVLISYDECASWKPLKLLQKGKTQYSNLVVLPDKSIGCIFESNTPSWQSINFVRFTLDWLTDGKDKVVPKEKPAEAVEPAKTE